MCPPPGAVCYIYSIFLLFLFYKLTSGCDHQWPFELWPFMNQISNELFTFLREAATSQGFIGPSTLSLPSWLCRFFRISDLNQSSCHWSFFFFTSFKMIHDATLSVGDQPRRCDVWCDRLDSAHTHRRGGKSGKSLFILGWVLLYKVIPLIS